MAIFNSYVSHYQRVSVGETWVEVGRVHILLAMIGTPWYPLVSLGTPWCVGGGSHLSPAAAPLVFVGQGIEAAREEAHIQALDLSNATRAQETQVLLRKKTGR